MAEACTATGGCKLGPRSEPLRPRGTGAATRQFRLQPDAQSAVRRGATIARPLTGAVRMTSTILN
jgi:hypothetical protein